jgi:antitoxin (DNA-binding transcriptional repressor) of toxin-antitoxin stability system
MGTTQVNMHEAKSRLSELARLAWEGEKVVIAKAGEPYLDLVPHRERRRDRKPGRLRGQIRMAPDFDETPEQLVRAFEGEE